LAMRQDVNRELVLRLLPAEIKGTIKSTDLDTALADSLYSGYIEKLKMATERVNHHDSLKIPESLAFRAISGLSREMVERLERAQPRDFGQVRRIHGLTPAALSIVLVYLTAQQSPVNHSKLNA
jgi:tRNA uridine 5-carboxymethylaminomethyl modification enzyme